MLKDLNFIFQTETSSWLQK